jgi:hypothetical protein
MQYALLIYSKPGAAGALSADEQEANHREYLDIRQLPGVVGGAALHPVETAATRPCSRNQARAGRTPCRPRSPPCRPPNSSTGGRSPLSTANSPTGPARP